jgi:hypothetical protein
MPSLVTKIRRQIPDVTASVVTVDASNRFFRKGGVPWLPNVAAGSWFAIQAISNADSTSFFDTLAAAGFNAAHVSVISNDTSRYPTTSGNHFAAPNWHNGVTTVPPFTTPGNFSTFNSTYAAHARERVLYMQSVGLFPIMMLDYIGWLGGGGSSDEGFADEMFGDTDAHMQSYGAAAETLLNDIDLMWTAVGDAVLSVGSTMESRMLAAISGVQSVNTGRLWGAHMSDGNGALPFDQVNIGAVTGITWSLYEYSDGGVRAWWRIEDGYGQSPTRPTWILDPSYETDPGNSTREDLRRRTHSCMCSGACSLAYSRGGADAWYLSTTNSWLTSLPGLADHILANTFWNSHAWYNMAPDLDSSYATNRGTHSQTSTNYITVLRSSTKLIAYYEIGANGNPTIDMTKFAGVGSTIQCRWWDPTNGSYKNVTGSPISTASSHAFPQSDAGNNSAGTTDWLLVIG